MLSSNYHVLYKLWFCNDLGNFFGKSKFRNIKIFVTLVLLTQKYRENYITCRFITECSYLKCHGCHTQFTIGILGIEVRSSNYSICWNKSTGLLATLLFIYL